MRIWNSPSPCPVKRTVPFSGALKSQNSSFSASRLKVETYLSSFAWKDRVYIPYHPCTVWCTTLVVFDGKLPIISANSCLSFSLQQHPPPFQRQVAAFLLRTVAAALSEAFRRSSAGTTCGRDRFEAVNAQLHSGIPEAIFDFKRFFNSFCSYIT